ncbi:hypothetical protein GCM10027053_22420 [Intrasporangium mesophilum]
MLGAAPSAPAATSTDLIAKVGLNTPYIGTSVEGQITPSPGAPTGVVYTYVWSDQMGELARTSTTATEQTLAVREKDFGRRIVLTVSASAPDGTTQTSSSPERLVDSWNDDVVYVYYSADLLRFESARLPSTFAADLGDVTVDYVWLRSGVAVPADAGAEPWTHRWVAADNGHTLSARRVARQASTAVTSTKDTRPTPVIGRYDTGATLIGTPHPFEGLAFTRRDVAYPPLSAGATPQVTVSWYRDGRPTGFTGDRYVVTSLDQGHELSAHPQLSLTGTPFPYSVWPMSVSVGVIPGRQFSYSLEAAVTVDRLRDVLWSPTPGTMRRIRANPRPGTIGLGSGVPLGSGWDVLTAFASGADVSGDGVADLIARRRDGALLLYRSTTRGVLQAPTVIGTGWNGMNLILTAGDVDWDGNGDVVARRASDGALLLYRGTLTGRLEAGRVIGTGFRRALTLVANDDRNGDGRVDLLATWPDGTMTSYAARVGGSLATGVRVGSGWASMARLLDGGDANRDGIADIYALDRSGNLWIYPGNGRGGFKPRMLANAGYPLTPRIY